MIAKLIRLKKLEQLWPPVCPVCASRPAVVCIAHEDDPLPVPAEELEAGLCPHCGRRRLTVPVIVGVAEDAI